MKSKGIRRWLILLVAVVVIVIAYSYLNRPRPIQVALYEVTGGEVKASVANTRAGTVKACRRARMSPAMGGQIAGLPAREGALVKKGDILMELWNEDLKAQLVLTQRETDASRARTGEACATADVADKESRRMLSLQSKGLASEEAVDVAVGKAKASAAACGATRAMVRVSQAREVVAQAALERTLLRAPFDGSVAEVNGEIGEFVTIARKEKVSEDWFVGGITNEIARGDGIIGALIRDPNMTKDVTEIKRVRTKKPL